MTTKEAIAFIGPAVEKRLQRWADLGAGSGTFTLALAQLIGPDGSVIAVERDRAALSALRRLALSPPAGSAHITVVDADLNAAGDNDRLDVELDGALFGNVLHFFEQPASILEKTRARLAAGGRIVVLEYDSHTANRWVPYPLAVDRLMTVAATAGFDAVQVVARRASRYHGTMYCAVLES